jgi:serine protease Do
MSKVSSIKHPLHHKPLAYGVAILSAGALAATAAFAITAPEGDSANANNNDKPAAVAAAPDVKVDHGALDRTRTPAGSFAPIVKKVAPSVVEVSVTERNGHGQMASANIPEGLRRFFGQQGEGQQFQGRGPALHGVGSGVIVSPDGYILTNNHVVQNASDIRVTLADGREFPGKVIGTDPQTDVALIKIKADSLPAMTFADSQETNVGDVVLAIGNPFGIGETVTEGIVSAKNRVTGGDMDQDFIQTDAAINPGNSGGALVDMDGRLVGINTAILSHSGGSQGVGFAIPANLCQWVMTSLVKTGHVERGFLGVSIQNVTPELAQDFKLDRVNGALVSDVTSGGPADQAGFKSGDVIREFNGHEIKDASQLKLAVAETAPGNKASVAIIRDGQPKTVEVNVAALPGKHEASNDNDGSNARDEALAGVGVTDLTSDVRAQANIPAGVTGAVISEVSPDSAAYDAGLRPGDVITEINHHPVRSAQDAVKDTEKPASAQTLVKVWHDGGILYLTVDESHAS